MSISQLINIGKIISDKVISLSDIEYLPLLMKDFLSKANGLYVFESALVIRPLSTNTVITDIRTWNNSNTWKSLYNIELEKYLFFAEDVFGNQFGVFDDIIYYFELETGDIEKFANSLEEWAKKIIDDYRFYTGYDFANQWQMVNGRIPADYRLCPKKPFILKGEYSLDNLVCSPILQNIQYLASIANQIHDIPDGTNVYVCLE